MRHLGLHAVLLAACVLTCLPAINNGFISDDYYYVGQMPVVHQDPVHLFRIPPGFSRAAGHLFFLVGHALSGEDARGYYALAIFLHCLNTWLVYLLVWRLTDQRAMAAVAALFFAVYERHREAVFWLSGTYELLFTLSVLLCILAWQRFLSSREAQGFGRPAWYLAALGGFLFALFTKESSVILVALLAAAEVFGSHTSPHRRLVRRAAAYLPFVVVSIAYAIAVRILNPLIGEGYYAVSWRFFSVYLRSLATLVQFVAVALVALVVAAGLPEVRALFRRPAWRFFLAWLAIAPVPYCFLTYLGQIPSRHTYFPSVATAALFGMSAVAFYERLATARGRVFARAALGLILIGNAGYVWLKDVQFVRRAQPTTLLVETLRSHSGGGSEPGKVYVISASEYWDVVLRAAATTLGKRADGEVVFVRPAEASNLQAGSRDLVFVMDDRAQRLAAARVPHD